MIRMIARILLLAIDRSLSAMHTPTFYVFIICLLTFVGLVFATSYSLVKKTPKRIKFITFLSWAVNFFPILFFFLSSDAPREKALEKISVLFQMMMGLDIGG